LGFLNASLESTPADAHRCVNAHQDEEWSSKELIQDFFGVNVCCYPSFTPLLCDKVQQIFCSAEGVTFRRVFGFCRAKLGNDAS
jgi:hypothetical protein